MPPADSWSRVRAPASALDKVGLRLDELIQLQTGRSSVGIRSLGELCVWLDECTYVSDDERIGLREHWSHPDEFERGRAGDCEDFALWTWWELGSLGYAAELLAGKQVGGGGPPGGGHVWVQFSVAGQEFLIDGTGGAASDMIRSLAEATDHFCPWFAVDRTFRVYCYSGYFQLSAGTVGRVAVTPRGGRADRADVLPPPPIFEPAETRTIEDPVPRAGEVRRSQRPPPPLDPERIQNQVDYERALEMQMRGRKGCVGDLLEEVRRPPLCGATRRKTGPREPTRR